MPISLKTWSVLPTKLLRLWRRGQISCPYLVKLQTKMLVSHFIICFPSECFNSPYGTQYFKDYAEGVPDGASCDALREAAIKNKVGP